MYGQTEATARMAYLPPSSPPCGPDAIGLPIPGARSAGAGRRVRRWAPASLVYTGPNVMMGYATSPADPGRRADTRAAHRRPGPSLRRRLRGRRPP